MPKPELVEQLAETFSQKVPFNKLLGLEFDQLDRDCCKVHFDNKPELVGNYIQGILHGGVIASAIDVAGGTMAALGLMQKNPESHPEELLDKLSRLGTIDLRIDYVRPGRGKRFETTAKILRTGNKVAVVRMELHNEENTLIALGTGTYLIG
ncbi:thioesterase family protein [Pleionea litopenaei]|uniref:Medium/long-chain acyl-CoA thioesterase YigI n=2 Tax=Pleionea litopenaei TaxID=3070815 RepID=A0AA51X8Q6_9GAMM|nr:thioesterase family protein [Pleionea sp. HL-JVS1]WMS89231.1 thioesterase family protein [Pleionea sp. HL-JVS1]